jgi:predicted nucleic acid-binding protein
MDKLYIDSDIILDLILEREPYFKCALELFTLIEEDKIKGFVSPLIFANLFYILRKAYSRLFALQVLQRLKTLLTIVPINEHIIEIALFSSFKDFEDAIQYYSALESRLTYLITRNKNDYKESGLIICSAGEYLALRASHA